MPSRSQYNCKIKDYGKFFGFEFCGSGGGTLVDGGIVCSDCGVVSTGGGFQWTTLHCTTLHCTFPRCNTLGQTFCDLHTHLHLFQLISHIIKQARCNFLISYSVIYAYFELYPFFQPNDFRIMYASQKILWKKVCKSQNTNKPFFLCNTLITNEVSLVPPKVLLIFDEPSSFQDLPSFLKFIYNPL